MPWTSGPTDHTRPGVASLTTMLPTRPRFAAAAAIAIAVVLTALTGVPALAAPTPTTTPSAPCPNPDAPPPPVDSSEQPKPGRTVPPPIPRPTEPVGGPALAGCQVLPSGAPALPANINAASWLLFDLDSGQVLAARDPHGRHRPASIIKVLTSMVVLRELNLDQTVTGTQEDADQEGSKVGIGPGGEYTVRQLLQGMLMNSGNDAAHALARQLGGVDETVRKMNELARELGATDTRAATPSGLDAAGMSSSAYDMALFFRAAMRDQNFARAVAQQRMSFPGYGNRPGFEIRNDDRLLIDYQGAIGGKTGFTDDARHTFIGAAQRGGQRLAVVLMRGEAKPLRLWEQSARLLDYGFNLPPKIAPVGRLVDGSREVSGQAVRNPENAGIETNLADAHTPFGSYGLPITVGAGVVVVLFGALTFRRRLARRRLAIARAARGGGNPAGG